MKKILFILFLSGIIITTAFGEGKVLVLKNQYVAFTFMEGSFSLKGLADQITGKEHLLPDNQAPGLWQLSFARGDQIITTTSNIALPAKGDISHTVNGVQTLKIVWSDLTLPELKDVQVEVIVNLPETSGIADWHIKVINNSKEWGLWEVYFPKISGFLESGKYDVYGSFGHENGRAESLGSLYKQYGERLDLTYPYGWGGMSMQFIGANSGSSGVYMATHDPRAWTKKFALEPGKEFYVKTYAENMGVAGSDFLDPFPFMLGVFQGDWMTAAKIYRAFAITAPWTAKGKVSAATSTPQSFKDITLWTSEGNYATDDNTIKNKIAQWDKARDFFGVPLGFHWYNWNIYKFDTHYPHFFPARKGVPEITRKLTDMGITVMPYINGRITDKSNEDFPKWLPYGSKNFEGYSYEEIYPSGKPQMAMCPTGVPYQDTIVNAVRVIADDLGAGSVYIDQIAAAPSNLCFDRSHGHPLGGGSYWVDGYRQMLQKIQKIAHGNGRDLSITSECTAEPFMDGIDGFLMVTPRSANTIPLISAVYSGYAIYFGSWDQSGKLSDEKFITLSGRDVLWGVKPGRFGLNMFNPGNEKRLNYLKTMGQTHYAGRKYFVYGELVKQVESVTKSEVTGIPDQMGTLWKAEDGSLALVMANFSEKAALFPVDMNLSGIVPEGTTFKSSRDLKNNTRSSIKIKSQAIAGNVSLGPLEMKIIEITK